MKSEIPYMKNRHTRLAGIVVLLLGFLVLTACGSGRNSNDTEADIESFRELRELVNSRNFEIENEWAMPLRGNRINLIGNPNHIRFEGDSVDIYLPYFGVRQSGGGYGRTDGGIIYKGTVENLDVVENAERRNLVLKFRGERGSEDLQFFITLFPNGRTNTNVSSSQRDAISYMGSIKRTQ